MSKRKGKERQNDIEIEKNGDKRNKGVQISGVCVTTKWMSGDIKDKVKRAVTIMGQV